MEKLNVVIADDDELMTLRYYAIPNVTVTKSEVKHLSQVVTNKIGIDKYRITDKKRYPLTDNELRRGLAWLWDDYRFYDAYRRMEKKWGNEQIRGRINRLLERFPILNKGAITRILYNRRVNSLLCILTGIRV